MNPEATLARGSWGKLRSVLQSIVQDGVTALLTALVGVMMWAWMFPRSLQHGANNILAQIAVRIPVAALKQRWIPEDDVPR